MVRGVDAVGVIGDDLVGEDLPEIPNENIINDLTRFTYEIESYVCIGRTFCKSSLMPCIR